MLNKPIWKGPQIEKFWGKVNILGKDECWVFQGGKNKAGYGVVQFEGKQRLAHRVAFYIANGHYPIDLACHKCDNPPCVNPNHLFDGDHYANTHDLQEKGLADYSHLKGAKHPRAKFPDPTINEIRTLYLTGNYSIQELSDKFKTSPPYTRQIVTNFKRYDPSYQPLLKNNVKQMGLLDFGNK